MDVYQCPGCELRFRMSNDLLDHLRVDHPSFEANTRTERDALLSAAHRHRHVRTYTPGPDGNAHD